jgi:hypothetical protein
MREGANNVAPNMAEAFSYYSHYEALIWRYIREQIGQGLREYYQVPKELPPELLALIMKLDVVEGNYLLHYSPDRNVDDPSESDLLFP